MAAQLARAEPSLLRMVGAVFLFVAFVLFVLVEALTCFYHLRCGRLLSHIYGACASERVGEHVQLPLRRRGGLRVRPGTISVDDGERNLQNPFEPGTRTGFAAGPIRMG